MGTLVRSSKRGPDLEAIARKVLAGLARGRQVARERQRATAAVHRQQVFDLAQAAMAAGRPSRGLAGSISRKLGLSERHCKRIIDGLFGMSDSMCEHGDVLSRKPGGSEYGKRSTG